MVADELFKLITHSPVVNHLGTADSGIFIALHHNPLSVLVIDKIPADVAQGGQTLGHLDGFLAELAPSGNLDTLNREMGVWMHINDPS